jgi:hypothetical protein
MPGYHRIHSRIGYHLRGLYSGASTCHGCLIVENLKLFGLRVNYDKVSTATKAWIDLGVEIRS